MIIIALSYLDLHFAPCSPIAIWCGKNMTHWNEKNGTLNASGSWCKISAAATCANMANPAELRLKWKERNGQKVESCEDSEDHIWVWKNIWKPFLLDTVYDCVFNFMMLAFSWHGDRVMIQSHTQALSFISGKPLRTHAATWLSATSGFCP